MPKHPVTRADLGRRVVSVSLPGDTFEAVHEASQLTNESISGFLALAGLERARRVRRRATGGANGAAVRLLGPGAADDEQPTDAAA